MPFTLTIPRPAAAAHLIELSVGQSAFLVGANGSGKSSLMHHFYAENHRNAQRISAHRQTWFTSHTVSMTPQQKRDAVSNFSGHDRQADSRWMEHNAVQRANMAIFDLINALNVRARNITDLIDDGEVDLAVTRAQKESPLRILNQLLRLSGIPIEISVRENEELLATKSGGTPYKVTQLSDGERNALLLASTVLTAPAETLLLIDEPERHLHRAIIAPLLTLLFSERKDCAFVVSTHDLTLLTENTEATTILVRDCTYDGDTVSSWDIDVLAPGAPVDERLKEDILGSRRKILFVEGAEQSLDKPLYAVLFQNISVIPKGSCRDVEHAVSGVRGTAALHWVSAYGIIDSDGRRPEVVEELRQRSVFALPVHSVESIYYHTEIQRRVAARVAGLTGNNAEAALTAARDAAIAAIHEHGARMSARVIEHKLRDQIGRSMPEQAAIADGLPIHISIDVSGMLAAERAQLQRYVDERDLQSLIARYPVRDTPALTLIASRLGLQSREQYEDSVRKLLMDDETALRLVRGLLEPLSGEIDA